MRVLDLTACPPLPLIQILVHFPLGETSFFPGDFVDEKRGLFGTEIHQIGTGDGADLAVDGCNLLGRYRWFVRCSVRQIEMERLILSLTPFHRLCNVVVREMFGMFPAIDGGVGETGAGQANRRSRAC